MKALLAIAVGGWILSTIAHLVTFLGIAPNKICPWIWLLHLGIFVVWFPMIFVSGKTMKPGYRKSFKELMPHAPSWMPRLCGILFAYALFNFFFTIFVLNKGGNPSVIDGEKVLQSHGKIIRKLSDEEYRWHEAYSVRMFSGHWMLFYGIATAVLLSRIKETGGGQAEKNPL